jgi:hypothetical protein
MMMEELVLRIRGTFIDIGTDASTALHKNRSRSTPPCPINRNNVSMTGDCGGSQYNKAEYISSLMEKADRLPQDVRRSRYDSDRACDTTVGARGPLVGASTLLQAACFKGPPAEAYHIESPTSCGTTRRSNSSDTAPSVDSWPQASTPDALDTCENAGLTENAKKQSLQCPSGAIEGTTTLMICDIPCRQNINQIIDAINVHGFENSYDLVYMPAHKASRVVNHFQNVGYAFVNFKRPEYASGFIQAFQNYSFPNCLSKKLSYARPAHHQGFQANLDMHLKQRRASGCRLITFCDEEPCVAWH